jgi:hypothetical protein
VLDLLRRKPWLWIVLLLGALVAANLVFLGISLRNPPVSVRAG